MLSDFNFMLAFISNILFFISKTGFSYTYYNWNWIERESLNICSSAEEARASDYLIIIIIVVVYRKNYKEWKTENKIDVYNCE